MGAERRPARLADVLHHLDVPRTAERLVAEYALELDGSDPGAPAVRREELEQVAGSVVRLLCRLLAEERSPTDAELEVLTWPVDVLRASSSLAVLQRLGRSGPRVVSREVTAALRQAPDLPLERRSTLVVHLNARVLALSTQVAAHITHRHLSWQPADVPRSALDQLLRGRAAGLAEARAWAESAGFLFGKGHAAAVLAVRGPGRPDDLDEVLRRVGKSAGTLPVRCGIGRLDSGIAVVCPREGRVEPVAELESFLSDVTEEGGVEVVAGIGGYLEGVDGLRGSYGQAAEVAGMLVESPALPRVMRYDRALPYLLLRGRLSMSLELYRAGVGALFEHDAGEHLAQTLRVYIDTGGNVARTAERLYVHRQTLYRRLERIERLTGGPLSDPHHLLILHLGLLAADLVDQSS